MNRAVSGHIMGPVRTVVEYARSTELNAVRALLHFMFNAGQPDNPYHFNPNMAPGTSTTNRALTLTYLKQYRGSNY